VTELIDYSVSEEGPALVQLPVPTHYYQQHPEWYFEFLLALGQMENKVVVDYQLIGH